jgi:hypothetical protein
MKLDSYRQMLWKRLKSWLGWDADSGSPSLTDLQPRSRGATPAPAPKIPVKGHARPTEPLPAAAQPRAKTERSPLEVLDNPRLTLEKPADDGLDPYNTGAFNRSASWERIGRQRKR